MTRHMGRLSLVVGVLSWFVLILAFAIGGLDPSPEQTPLLRAASMGALVAAAVALCLAVVALARGPQRVAAGIGLAVSLLFLLYFTGLGFVLLASRNDTLTARPWPAAHLTGC